MAVRPRALDSRAGPTHARGWGRRGRCCGVCIHRGLRPPCLGSRAAEISNSAPLLSSSPPVVSASSSALVAVSASTPAPEAATGLRARDVLTLCCRPHKEAVARVGGAPKPTARCGPQGPRACGRLLPTEFDPFANCAIRGARFGPRLHRVPQFSMPLQTWPPGQARQCFLRRGHAASASLLRRSIARAAP